MQVIEVIRAGFNGASDATDDLVLWIAAPGRDVVQDMITRHGLEKEVVMGSDDVPITTPASTIDFVLPDDEERLVEMLRSVPPAAAPTCTLPLWALRALTLMGQAYASDAVKHINDGSCSVADIPALPLFESALAAAQAQIEAPTPSSGKDAKFFRTVFEVEVLSEETPTGHLSLDEVAEAITTGDCSGVTRVVRVEGLSAKATAEALIAQGSDPDFFSLDLDALKAGETSTPAYEIDVATHALPGSEAISDVRLAAALKLTAVSGQTALLSVTLAGNSYTLLLQGYLEGVADEKTEFDGESVTPDILLRIETESFDAGINVTSNPWFEWVDAGGVAVGEPFDEIALNPVIEIGRLRGIVVNTPPDPVVKVQAVGSTEDADEAGFTDWAISPNLTDRWGEINEANSTTKPLIDFTADPGLLPRLQAQMWDEATFVVRKSGQYGVLFEVEFCSRESEEETKERDPQYYATLHPHASVVKGILAKLNALAPQYPGVEFAVPAKEQVFNHRPAAWAFVRDGLLDATQRATLGRSLLAL